MKWWEIVLIVYFAGMGITLPLIWHLSTKNRPSLKEFVFSVACWPVVWYVFWKMRRF